MKKLAFIIVTITLISLLSGCGAKQKMEDKIAEKIVETALGDNVNIDGEEVTIEGEEGSVTFGSTEWPNSDLAKKIPEFKNGKITSVMNSEAYLFIIIEEVGVNDFMDYYEEVKAVYTEDSYESKFEDVISYSGSDKEGFTVVVSYSTEDKTTSIQASQAEKIE